MKKANVCIKATTKCYCLLWMVLCEGLMSSRELQGKGGAKNTASIILKGLEKIKTKQTQQGKMKTGGRFKGSSRLWKVESWEFEAGKFAAKVTSRDEKVERDTWLPLSSPSCGFSHWMTVYLQEKCDLSAGCSLFFDWVTQTLCWRVGRRGRTRRWRWWRRKGLFSSPPPSRSPG